MDREDNIDYYYIPTELFTNSKYKELNSDTKILYAILFDIHKNSIKGKSVHKNGMISITFTRQEAMYLIGCNNNTIIKCFKSLIKLNLIEEKKQGLGKPNILFVKNLKGEN